MSLKSMTGFGRGQASAAGLKAEVEIGSVNRRQFDVRVSLPRALSPMESRVREQIHRAIVRGCVTCNVKVAAAGDGGSRTVAIDRHLLRAIVREVRKSAGEIGLADDLSASSVLRVAEVMRYEDATEDSERAWRLVSRALAAALRDLLAMRAAEGAALAADLEKRVSGLRHRVAAIRELAPHVLRRFRRSLEARLKREGLDIAAASEAMARELVVFADRSDISEELVRLDSHLDQAGELLRLREPAGRSLDFLCQEMFREINTIASKGNDARISRQVIHFKTELECIREQVQNVE